MNECMLKKNAWDCKKTTFLIEKKDAGSLTIREKLELKIRLAGCSLRKIFQEQSIMINKVINWVFYQPKHNKFKLDDKFKRQLQDRINEKLEKK
jgi:hypothetical protein